MTASTTPAAPEHNVTGQDYRDRAHFRSAGPIIDVHAHVMRTRPTDPPTGPPPNGGPGATLDQAELMLEVAQEFGVEKVYSMCHVDDIAPLRERFGERIGFIGSIAKKPEEADDVAYRLLDDYLAAGVVALKFWAAPRGRARGLIVDAPWRVESARRALAAGVRVIMVHVGDPDVWFRTTYADAAKFGFKADQYLGLTRLLDEFPDIDFIGAHLGGDPEHPDHLAELLEEYPNLSLDTSATKWQVREVSAKRDEIYDLVSRYPDRFLFGSDLVTRHGLERDHYVSRYWCQRTLWESLWKGQSPIFDPDYQPAPGTPTTPRLLGLELPPEVLEWMYYRNASTLLHRAVGNTRTAT